ncbi:DUF3833 domain-containing protein [Vibrio hippocampi]|uniref:DUF3833 domain-containing protein n=1 Tax=Vibrio hippocampi TaxID=654686 RepID=A0ABN8DLT5_9VIBR|nr:DUF3833 domain-containing protein [Vibrio hippocampi]CAH0526482.1 hypothetical protein VHP8226_01836 [Vibrio hippocampi]
MKRLHPFWLLLLTLFVSACSSDIDDYQQTQPSFDLFGYFEGKTLAWGMVQDYTDQQTRRFTVSIIGTIEGDTLVLEEDFVFDDGELDRRVWVISRLDNGRYVGEADDIVGTAEGIEVGNALHWKYDFNLEVDDSSHTVTFDDWLYRQDEKHLFNLTSIKKWGVEVGRITLFFQK